MGLYLSPQGDRVIAQSIARTTVGEPATLAKASLMKVVLLRLSPLGCHSLLPGFQGSHKESFICG